MYVRTQYNKYQKGNIIDITILYNQGAIRVGDFKLMFAPHFNKDGWYNPGDMIYNNNII